MKGKVKRYCNRCGELVVKEPNIDLKKEYPYVCLECDENLYEIETYIKQ